MAKNILVINVDIRETRVALIEGGIIAELHIERHNAKGTLGNVYLGKVSRVLPGMQAAFIDIGEERAAFLHVEDLIRPDDFEAYLAGKKKGGPSDDEHTHGRDEMGEDDSAPVRASEALAAPSSHLQELADDLGGHSDDDEDDEEDDDHAHGDAESGAHDEQHDEQHHADVDAAFSDDDGDDAGDDSEEPIAAAADSQAGSDSAAGDRDSDADSDDDRDNEVDGDNDVDADNDNDNDNEVDSDHDGDNDNEGDHEHSAHAGGDVPSAEPSASGEARAEQADPHGADEGIDVDVMFSVSDADEGEEAPARESEGAGVPTASEPGAENLDEAGRTAARARSRRGSRGRRRSGRTVDRIKPEQATALAEARPLPPPAQGGTGRSAQGRGQGRANDRPREGDRGGDRSRSQGDRGRGGDRGRSQGGRASKQRGRSDSRDRRTKADPLRVSKTTPIREVVREGQEVVVQVSKEPIGTKGARVTSHISLPGRYVVYLPTVEHVGISKRIGSEKERGRLREAIDAMKPPTGGLVVRTLAEGLTKKSLKSDVGYLVRLWGEIAKKRETAARAPEVLYSELDLVLKTARDLFTDDIEEIVIDNKEEYIRLRRFVEMFMPERAAAIQYYDGEEPIFDAYGIEEEIGRALSRKVPLTSGGHLIIDQAEALTAIDVNTGRFVGKGSKDLEDTILRTNIEAVEEIAYQLRFRNIGGLIILDLIDMERAGNREKVRRHLDQLLEKDKAKTTVNRISDLGLIEMTRKRTRESLGRLMNEACFYCDGTGNLQSKQTVCYEILRQIKRERMSLRGYAVVVNAHPAVIDLLKNEERTAVQEAERRYQRRIDLVARKEYHLEQFDLIGK